MKSIKFYDFYQDLHMVNLEEFKYGGTNLTAFRLLDPEKPEVKQVVEDWIYGEMRYGRKLDTSVMSVKVKNHTKIMMKPLPFTNNFLTLYIM